MRWHLGKLPVHVAKDFNSQPQAAVTYTQTSILSQLCDPLCTLSHVFKSETCGCCPIKCIHLHGTYLYIHRM
jgi:hypothetical protein